MHLEVGLVGVDNEADSFDPRLLRLDRQRGEGARTAPRTRVVVEANRRPTSLVARDDHDLLAGGKEQAAQLAHGETRHVEVAGKAKLDTKRGRVLF